ncbi:MAG: hypothetical protein O2954_02270 [bacterium]|nr:hypothetical protein [bacterium]
MKIGIDIDGVTADFVTAFMPVLTEVLGRPVCYEEMTSYRFQDTFGYSDEVEAHLQAEIDRRDLMRTLPVMPGALEAVQRFVRNHEVHFITARTESRWGEVTQAWLDSRGFPYTSVRFREGRKAEAREGFDLFLEDYLDNALDLVTQEIHVCLFDHPWNQCETLPSACTRVRTWAEVETVAASLG